MKAVHLFLLCVYLFILYILYPIALLLDVVALPFYAVAFIAALCGGGFTGSASFTRRLQEKLRVAKANAQLKLLRTKAPAKAPATAMPAAAVHP